jgi:hypothetical protein
VYVGSYSQQFFCMDAATGNILWKFKANGPISGSPTVIAGRVYFATLKGTTYALDARTGGQLWTYPDGKYSPVVADADRLYLTGNARIYGLVEKRTAKKPAPKPTTRILSASRVVTILRRSGYRRAAIINGPTTVVHQVAIEGGIGALRFDSIAAARKYNGVQVCNVILHKAKGTSPERFWSAVRAVQKACRG